MAAPQSAQQEGNAAFYDDDIDSLEGSDVEISYAQGAGAADYPQGYDEDQYAQEQQVAQAALFAAQQAQEAEAALAAVPNEVKRYIVTLYQHISNGQTQDIANDYEVQWNRLTDKYFKNEGAEWPVAEIIAPLVNNDEVFLTCYKELYYRYVYSRLLPDIDDRFHSYENYCAIFNYILNSDAPVPLALPTSWLYDIVDEFIYQFSNFAQWRSKVDRVKEEEAADLIDHPQVWSCYSVLNVLYSLIQKSKIQEQLAAIRRGEDPDEVAGEYGSKPLYRMLGYFSIIGLLRVHVLLGDYTLALKMMDEIELSKKAWFTRVPAAHVTVYYYIGFSYMMLRRYPDAIRSFSQILSSIQRLRYRGGGLYDQINKTADRMYALLAISVALWPTKVDDSVAQVMKEKNNEQYQRMIKGGETAIPAFKELFSFAAPKWISSNSPPFADPAALEAYKASPDPSSHHLKIFLSSIEPWLRTPDLKTSMKLYTTLGTGKLAGLLKMDEEELVEDLLVMKGAGRNVRWMDGLGGLLEGEEVANSDLDLLIDDNIVTVTEVRPVRRFGDYFLRHAAKAQDMYENIRNRELPISKNLLQAQQQHQQQQAANAAAAVAAGGASQPATAATTSVVGSTSAAPVKGAATPAATPTTAAGTGGEEKKQFRWGAGVKA